MNGDPLTYDANGSLTAYTPATGNNSSFTWDVRNRLVGMTRTGASPLTASFAYDYAGRRRSKTLNGTTTTFDYDGADLVNDSAGGVTVHGPGIDQPLVRGGQFGQYYSQDRQGSVTALTDWTGSVTQQYGYSPFGEASQTTGVPNPLQYTGRENDDTALMYYRARYYAPEWGRFISEDPIGFAGGENQYAYADNNPANATDPSGLVKIVQRYRQVNVAGVGTPVYHIDIIVSGYEYDGTYVEWLFAGEWSGFPKNELIGVSHAYDPNQFKYAAEDVLLDTGDDDPATPYLDAFQAVVDKINSLHLTYFPFPELVPGTYNSGGVARAIIEWSGYNIPLPTKAGIKRRHGLYTPGYDKRLPTSAPASIPTIGDSYFFMFAPGAG